MRKEKVQMENIFSDFKVFKPVNKEVIEQYENILPQKVIEIWRKYGFGSFLNDFLKVINPNDYRELLQESYFRNDIAIPVFATGLGDIITWEENKYLMMIKYRKSKLKGLSVKYFFSDLQDEEFVGEELDSSQYFLAEKEYGSIQFDECFGYTPLLGLGGPEKFENLKKVKLREHIYLITQLIGPIQ
jgi:hypothetical protein